MSKIKNDSQGRKRNPIINLQAILISLVLVAFTGTLAFGDKTPSSGLDKQANKSLLERAFKIQMPFIPNQGQIADEHVRFYVKTFGGALSVTDSGEMVYSFTVLEPQSGPKEKHTRRPSNNEIVKSWMLKEKLVGNLNPVLQGMDESKAKANYFIGNDRNKWKTDITTYNVVSLGEIYKGIELKLKAYGKNVEKIFTVKPGANPQAIKLNMEGANSLNINDKGELEVGTDLSIVKFAKPLAYQEIDGKRVEVKVAYSLENSTLDTQPLSPIYGFKVGDYDTSTPLIIDPILVYSTYKGGSGDEIGHGIAVDSSGNAYIAAAGNTGGLWVAFVTKIDPVGNQLHSGFIGGNANSYGLGIAVDSSGKVYLAGYTEASNFPQAPLPNPIQAAYRGGADAFVTKMNADFSLAYSTYLGGTCFDQATGIAVDSSGNAYITGQTCSVSANPPDNFPTTPSAYKTTITSGDVDAFVTKINFDGTALVYSTYLGGTIKATDTGNAIAVDNNGHAYIAGSTQSTDFPTWNAFQSTLNGTWDGFVTKLNVAGSDLVYSTYLGGSSGLEDAAGIAVDSSGNAYITGVTYSTDFPTLNPIQGTLVGLSDAYVAKINSIAALVYSTYLGSDCSGAAIAVDNSGNVYVTGQAYSFSFPTMNPIQATYAGGVDAFVTKINAAGNSLVYSTYLGGSDFDTGHGIAVDGSGNAYITGETSSTNFPTMNPLQSNNAGGTDAFVAKISREMIDRNVWADLEFVRRINNGVLESALRSYGVWVNNNMVFPDPNFISSIRADVTVTELLNEGAWLRARVDGRFYKNPVGNDIHAQIGILHTQTEGLRGYFGIIECYDEECGPDSQRTIRWEYPSGWTASLGQTKTLSLSWNGGTVFTFNFDGNVITRDAIDYDPTATNAGTPQFPYKGFGTRVSHPDTPTSGGYIAATFDNVYKNGVPPQPVYDDFNDPSGLIDETRWARWEFLRRAEGGVLESELTRYESNGSNSTNFINADAVTGFQADVTVTDYVNVGAVPQARLTGAFYNDGTPGDGRAGDIISSIGIRHNGSQLVRFYAITQCLSGNCNNPSGSGLPDQYNTLTYEEIAGQVSIGETHRLSVTWNGSQFTFGFDGVLITPSISLPPVVGPPTTSLKGIGTRVIGIDDNPSSDWGYIAATFDNVVVLSMGYPLAVAKSGTGNGTVTSSPTGINCGSDCIEIYASDTPVTLAATPGAGSTFFGWSGCDSTNGNQCTVTMNAARSVTATFTINTYTVTASVVNPIGGSVTPPLSQTVSYGGTATFIVTTNAGYTASVSEGTLEGNTWTIPNVTSTHPVTVTFTIITYTVTASVTGDPAGGSVTPPSQTVDYGGTATFTVTTNTGFTASVSEGTLEGNTWTIPNVTSTHPVTVTFTIVPNPPPAITGITPNYGNTGSIDNFFMIDGTGFMSGATVKLTRSGQSDIFASGYEPIAPTQIRCRISLLGAVEGLWNVVVTNPDTQFSTLTNGFTVNPPGCPTPGMPSNPLPSDGATNRPINQTLNWATSTNADSYDVYFGSTENPPFVGNVVGISYAPSGLNPNTTYYWKIVAKNTCFNSTAGPLWSFTTVPAIPAPPILASPGNGETGVGLSPTLVWNAPPGAISSYYLQVSADNFSTFVFNGSVTATSQTLTSPPLTGPLPIETTYSWRVYATNTQGDSAWSDVWTFITQPAYGNLFEGVRGIADPDNDADGLDDVIHEGPNGLLGNGTVGPDPTKRTLFVKPKKVKVNPDGTEIFPPQYEYWSGFIALFPDSRPGFANIQAFTKAGIEIMVVGDPNSPYPPMREFTYDPGNDSSHPPCDIMEIIYKGPISYCVEGSHNNGHTYFYTSGPNWSWDTKGYCPSTAGIHGYKTPRIYPFPLDNYFKEGAYSSIIQGGTPGGVLNCTSTNCTSSSPLNVNTTNAVNGPPDGTVEFNPITFGQSGNISSVGAIPSTGYDINTVLRRTTVHEMGHALLAGMDSDHCADPNCIMYTSVADWQMHDFGPGNCVHKSGGSKDIRSAGVIHNSVHGLVATPAPPTLASPADLATGVATNPTLSWNASTGATSYGLQVSTNSSSFSPTVVNQTGITSTSRAISGLLNGTTYYWRVNATNAGGTSAWSAPVRSFTTVVVLPPPVPNLSSPLNNATNVSRTPPLRWNASTGATSYRVQVSTDSTFDPSITPLKVNVTRTSTSYTIPSSNALSGTTVYYWRVNATNSAGVTSGWSNVWHFTTRQ